MTAEREEVVIDTNVFGVQNVSPNTGENLFSRSARCNEILVCLELVATRRWQSQAIHLAAGSQRELVEQHKCRGNHVVRQLATQMCA